MELIVLAILNRTFKSRAIRPTSVPNLAVGASSGTSSMPNMNNLPSGVRIEGYEATRLARRHQRYDEVT